MKETDWIYYSIYPGRIEYLDDLVTDLVAPAVERLAERDEVRRWFFIRYVDEQGPHVRLRFQVDSEACGSISDELERWIDRQLTEITSRPVPAMARLMPVPQGKPEQEYEVTFQPETYEPEYEKYGGVPGVAIAETCFEASSKLAVSAVRAIQGGELDRFILALHIMKQTAECLPFPEKARKELWERVLHHWSGADYPGGSEVKESLLRAASKRRSVIEERIRANGDSQLIVELVAPYMEALRGAFEAVKQTPQIRLSTSHLLFHYIHMMNNRLGVWPIEEAYLGSLLLSLENLEMIQ